jgi:hypothetical protein
VRVIQQRLLARLIRGPELAVLWPDDGAAPLYLRFGLPELEREGFIFPSLLLDDWGREISNLSLYDWIQANGDQFPRAELFGLSRAGHSEQRFLRELDLSARLACVAAVNPGAPMASCATVGAIALSDPTATEIQHVGPLWREGPIGRAAVSWWRAPAGAEVDIGALFP